MDTMLKRLLSFAVALVMVVGLMPWSAASVYATEEDAPAPAAEEESPTTDPTAGFALPDQSIVHGHTCPHCDNAAPEDGWQEWPESGTPTASGHYYLTGNVTLTATWSVSKDITLCLNGYTLGVSETSDIRVVSIGAGGVLSLMDCGSTGKLQGSPLCTKNGGLILMNRSTTAGVAGAVFNLYSGTLTGATSSSSNGGGAVYVQGTNNSDVAPGTFYMYGGTITGNKTTHASGSGGGVFISGPTGTGTKGAIFQMTGGTISNNETKASGGGVFAGPSAQLTIKNATISGNTAAADGGGMYADKNAELTMSGCVLSGNTASKEGGAIRFGVGVAANISNTEISGNTAATGALRTANDTVLSITGGSIKNNTAQNAAALEILGTAKVTLDGVSITGNQSTSNAGYGAVDLGNANATLILKGAAQIAGNTHKSTQAMNLFIRSAIGNIDLTGLSGDARVGITLQDFTGADGATKTFATVSEGEAWKSQVESDNADTLHILQDTTTTLKMGAHDWVDGEPVPATCVTPGTTTSTCSGCSETKVVENEPATGVHNYVDYVCTVCQQEDPQKPSAVHKGGEHKCEGCDTTVWTPWNSAITLPTTSGHYYLTSNVTMTAAWELGTKGEQNDLQIALCLNGFTITPAENAKVVRVNQGVTFTLTNCPEEAKVALETRNTGMGTFFYGEKGATMNISNVIISGGQGTGNGGAIFAAQGTAELYATVVLKNCQITNNSTNTTEALGGGAIYAGQYAQVTITGCEISGNEATNKAGGAIYANGNAQITINDSTISGNTAGSTGGAIYAAASAIVSVSNSEISENTSTGAGAAVFVTSGAELAVTGGSIVSNTAGGNGGAIFVGGTNATTYGTVRLTDCQIKDNSSTTATSFGGGAIYAGSYAQVTAENCTITGNTSGAKFGGAIYMNTNTVLTVTGGSISDNSVTNTSEDAGNGGAVYVRGTANITGCTISGNTAVGSGRGLYINGGNVTLTNTNITGNGTGTYMVYIASGSLEMTGGKIGDATAAGSTGVYIAGGTFTMNSGTIGNIGSGRGVWVAGGTFEMKGGEITDCTLGGEGVGVRVGGVFNMSGGKIYGNTANNQNTNAGVKVEGTGTFTMTGGEIYDNACPQYTGDSASQVVAAAAEAVIEISGTARIAKNELENSKYAVYIHAGTGTVTGGTFSGRMGRNNDEGGELVISGGTYDEGVDVSAFVAPGYRQFGNRVVKICAVHTYADGTCEDCGTVVRFTSRNVELTSILGVRFNAPAAEGITVKIAVGDGEAIVVEPTPSVTKSGYNEYKVDVFAQDMTKEIVGYIYNSEGTELSRQTFTLAKYVEDIKVVTDQKQEIIDLAEATLTYCQYAADKKYGTTDAVADVTIAEGTLNEFTIGNPDELKSLRVNGYLDEACELWVLFSQSVYADCTVNGTAVAELETTNRNGVAYYVCKVTDILPQNYGADQTFTVANAVGKVGTVTLSVLAYIKGCLEKNLGEQADQNLMKAMYHYYAAADAYLQSEQNPAA